MTREKASPPSKYTCNEYREEMILLALKQKTKQPGLTAEERKELGMEIARLEKEIGF